MKDNRYIQCILCEGIDMADSVRRFNEEMRRLKEFEPTFERDGDRFLIYVRCKQLQPENIVEAKEMKGIHHTCVECEHCVRQNNRYGVPDGRIKKAICKKNGQPTKITSSVCETYYLEHQDEDERRYKKAKIAKGA